MIYEGDKNVISAIKEKKRLIEAGEDHSHIRPLIILGGGLMKGIYGAGALIALDKNGMSKIFDYAAGVSSGVPSLAYFLSGQSSLITDLAVNESTDKNFIRRWHLKNVVNTDYFISVVEGLTNKALDFKKLCDSRTKLYVFVSDFETANPKLLVPKTFRNFLLAVQATISIPGVVTTPVYIEGRRYVDGASTQPYALDVAYDYFDSTHTLVIMNQDKNQSKPSLFEWFMSQTVLRHRFSPMLRAAANKRHTARGLFADRVLSDDKPTAVVWGDSTVNSYETAPNKLRTAIARSENWWNDLLSE
jgi:predicted patatin/cPLA2 family phospholipase